MQATRTALLILGCAIFAACTPPAPATGGFTGATSSESAFTSSPSGCDYSFIYETFVIRRAAPIDGAPAQAAITQSRQATLTASPHVAGSNVAITVRGAALSAGGANGQLEIAFADSTQTFDLSIPATEGEAIGSFEHTFTAPAVSGVNTLRITATLAADPATEAQIHIDTADLAIQEASYCASVPAN